MPLSDAQKVYKNIVLLPGDYFKSKTEIFQVKEKEMFYCKCEDMPCDHLYKTTYRIESVNTRKQYQVTQKYINKRFASKEITETSYHKGQWT